jgi:hypothetical protein
MLSDTIVVRRLIDHGRLPGPVDEAVWTIRRHLPTIATAEHAADLIARANIAREPGARRAT